MTIVEINETGTYFLFFFSKVNIKNIDIKYKIKIILFPLKIIAKIKIINKAAEINDK